VKAKVSRIMVTASLVAAMGFTAACGGDGDAATGKKPSKPTSTETARAAGEVTESPQGADGPLTEAQLNNAALTTDDVKGFKVRDSGIADLQGQSVPARPAACQPVADLFLSATDPVSAAAVSRDVGAEDETDASVIMIALLSYEPGEADEVLAGLRKATDTCTAYGHVGYEYTGVRALADPGLGDDSVAFRLVASVEGATVPTGFTVVRDGTTLAAFTSMNMLDADKAEVPEKIIEAQLAKLKKQAEEAKVNRPS
jgi:hypothetical protein